MYMERFWDTAFGRSILYPIRYFCYVDDTFRISSHGSEKPNGFPDSLKIIHHSIRFSTETACLTSRTSIFRKKPDVSLGHVGYRKHTATHPIAISYIPPRYTGPGLCAAGTACMINIIFSRSYPGYINRLIRRGVSPPASVVTVHNDPDYVAFLPYVDTHSAVLAGICLRTP